MTEDSFDKARKAFFAPAKETSEPSAFPAEFKARNEPPQKKPAVGGSLRSSAE